MRRKTRALIQVAMALLDDPRGQHWGYELTKRSGVRSGVLYPMLSRMLEEGWVRDGWEDPTTMRDKRPPRRYYELTDHGRRALGGVIQEARHDARFADVFTNPGAAGLQLGAARPCSILPGRFA
ncbi:MAG: PadR family transcriptional regulator [Pseudonocardiaceae bacterium]